MSDSIGYTNFEITSIQVVHTFPESDRFYVIYVTDYSGPNEQLSAINASWCPAALHSQVLRIELWDASKERGPTIEAKQILQLRNVRARGSSNGLLEAKMQEMKIWPTSSGEHYNALQEYVFY